MIGSSKSMIQTRRSLNTIDSIITPSFDRRNIRNIRVKFSSFWFLVERCSMPFLHELTGMWVQAALGCGCRQRHAQMYWLTSYIKMARCQALKPVKSARRCCFTRQRRLHIAARLVDTSHALGGAVHSHYSNCVNAGGSAQKYFERCSVTL
jgi:hypothetical protein